jgi:hypothetical protein
MQIKTALIFLRSETSGLTKWKEARLFHSISAIFPSLVSNSTCYESLWIAGVARKHNMKKTVFPLG